MRCWPRSCGLNEALSGTALRGPALNCQTTPSVRPLKWQLEHDCQPSCDRRSLVDTIAPAGRLKFPREEKNTSAPAVTTSPGVPGAGSGAVGMTFTTLSVPRSTTDTLRVTKLLTYARVPARLTTIPCGFFPALAPLVAGLAGSLRTMERVVSASTVLASLPSAPTLTLTSTSLPAETTYAAPGP